MMTQIICDIGVFSLYFLQVWCIFNIFHEIRISSNNECWYDTWALSKCFFSRKTFIHFLRAVIYVLSSIFKRIISCGVIINKKSWCRIFFQTFQGPDWYVLNNKKLTSERNIFLLVRLTMLSNMFAKKIK